jgi:hypothetical protein
MLPRHITTAIDDQIKSHIDNYAPFLDPSTPLLNAGADRLYFARDYTGSEWLGGPEDNLDG